jgi:protein FrlC
MAIYGEDLDNAWSQLAKSIRELLSYSSSYDLTLLIEPAHPAESNVIRTVREALRMIEDTKPGELGILLDTGHVRLNQENLAQAVSELRSVPFHIHIDDNNGDNDAHLIPGEGSIDFKSFAGALKRVGYGGFVSAELGFHCAIDPDYAAKKTLVFLKRLFGT